MRKPMIEFLNLPSKIIEYIEAKFKE